MTLAQQLLDVGYAKGCSRLSQRQLKEILAYTAQFLLVCPVPTGVATQPQADGTVIVTWGAPPTVVKTTEVWASLDNITFSLATTVNAPTATATLSAGVANYVKLRFCE